MIKLCEDFVIALDDGKYAALLLMDLLKALDCLPHAPMTVQLYVVVYGMSHEAVRLIMRYLRDRKQRVRIGEYTREWMIFLKGVVPQGFTLGSCSISLCLNDLMVALKQNNPANYADDNALCATGNSLRDANQKLVADGNIWLYITVLSCVMAYAHSTKHA